MKPTPPNPCPKPSPLPARSRPSTPRLWSSREVADLTPENVEALLEGTELILDGTDNFETRYLINDFAVKHSLPWIYTAAVGSYGVTLNVLPGKTACLACIFPDSPKGTLETCETAGILNSAVNLAASLAATEALKLLVGAEDRLRRTLLSFDVWSNQRAEVAAAKPRAGCRACGSGISFIWRARDARISRSAAATRCRFTSAIAPSIWPR